MYDVIIKNGLVFDGLGNKGENINIGIKNGKIRLLSPSLEVRGREEIDAEGRYVCPGFIDIDNSADHYLQIFTAPQAENLIRQGVTTVIGGNCGVSLAPLISGSLRSLRRWVDPSRTNVDWHTLAEFLALLEKNKIGVNFGTLLGWGTLRTELAGEGFRNLTVEELEKLKLLVEQGLQQGAFGVSFGLGYAPEKVVGYREALAIAELVNKYHGYLSFHLRDEGEKFLLSVDEVVELAQRGKISVEISHLKVIAPPYFKDFPRALKLITQANQKRELINFDLYPYSSSEQVLSLIVPQWVMIGGRKVFLKNIHQEEEKREIIKELKRRRYLYQDLIIADSGREWWFSGKTLKEIARDFNLSLEEGILKLLQECEDKITVFTKNISLDNLEEGIGSPYSLIASNDGFYNLGNTPRRSLVHPRAFGTFPYFLGHYAREKKLLSWEKAINKITGKVAKKIGLEKRGIIKDDYWADLVVFNPQIIDSQANLTDPFQYPQGIETVIINGQLAYHKGRLSRERYGKILRHK